MYPQYGSAHGANNRPVALAKSKEKTKTLADVTSDVPRKNKNKPKPKLQLDTVKESAEWADASASSCAIAEGDEDDLDLKPAQKAQSALAKYGGSAAGRAGPPALSKYGGGGLTTASSLSSSSAVIQKSRSPSPEGLQDDESRGPQCSSVESPNSSPEQSPEVSPRGRPLGSPTSSPAARSPARSPVRSGSPDESGAIPSPERSSSRSPSPGSRSRSQSGSPAKSPHVTKLSPEYHDARESDDEFEVELADGDPLLAQGRNKNVDQSDEEVEFDFPEVTLKDSAKTHSVQSDNAVMHTELVEDSESSDDEDRGSASLQLKRSQQDQSLLSSPSSPTQPQSSDVPQSRNVQSDTAASADEALSSLQSFQDGMEVFIEDESDDELPMPASPDKDRPKTLTSSAKLEQDSGDEAIDLEVFGTDGDSVESPSLEKHAGRVFLKLEEDDENSIEDDKPVSKVTDSYQASVPEVTSKPIEQMTLLAAMDAAIDSSEHEEAPQGNHQAIKDPKNAPRSSLLEIISADMDDDDDLDMDGDDDDAPLLELLPSPKKSAPTAAPRLEKPVPTPVRTFEKPATEQETSSAPAPSLTGGLPKSGQAGGLLAMMDMAVESVEKASKQSIDAKPKDQSKTDDVAQKWSPEKIPKKKEPEEAGEEPVDDDSLVKQKAAAGATSRLISGSSDRTATPLSATPARAGGAAHKKFMAPTNPMDTILNQKKAPETTVADIPESDEKVPLKSQPEAYISKSVLSGLRRDYDSSNKGPGFSNASASSSSAAPQKKAPEETAEDSPDRAPAIEEVSADVWEEVGKKTEEMATRHRETAGTVSQKETGVEAPVTYREAFSTWILRMDMDPEILQQLDTEQTQGKSCGCIPSRRSLRDVPGLSKSLGAEKDLVLCLMRTKYDPGVMMHFRMLRSIYAKLTRSKMVLPVGNHWDVIGFQTSDPCIDLNRFGGILNVVQLLYFFSNHFELFKDVHRISREMYDGCNQNFPFALAGINLTKEVMEHGFLSGNLSSMCNKGKDGVLETINKVYVAAFWVLYDRTKRWKRKTIEFEKSIKEVRKLLERPAKLLDEFERGIANIKAKNDPGKLEFTDMDFGTAGNNTSSQQKPASKAPAIPKRLQGYHMVGEDD